MAEPHTRPPQPFKLRMRRYDPESGQARGNMDDFDAAEVANGIYELYEPLAEDDGMTLTVKTSAAPVHGNRELIVRHH